MATLGEAIKERRLQADLTMVELADKVGITQPHVSMIETGKRTPSMETLYRIAAALDCEPADLITNTSLPGRHSSQQADEQATAPAKGAA